MSAICEYGVCHVAKLSKIKHMWHLQMICSKFAIEVNPFFRPVSSVARVSSVVRVARVSSIARVSAGGSSNCLRTLRDSCLLFPFLIMYTLHDGLVMGPIQITANINSKQLYKL